MKLIAYTCVAIVAWQVSVLAWDIIGAKLDTMLDEAFDLSKL